MKGNTMQKNVELLDIHETADLLRLSVPTVRLYLYRSRQGVGSFPEPINGFRRKCFWLRTTIESYLLQLAGEQNNHTPPVEVSAATSAKLKRHRLATG